jgi:hypothetical protein
MSLREERVVEKLHRLDKIPTQPRSQNVTSRIEIEIVYNMYRVKPAYVFGPPLYVPLVVLY